jgi:hypothetical protein
MSDEFALRKQVEAAGRAKTVLDSLAYKDAYGAVRDAIIESWEQCPIRDREGAHELKIMLKLHKDIHGHMEKAVADGRFAAEELKRDKSFSEKLKDRLRIA